MPGATRSQPRILFTVPLLACLVAALALLTAASIVYAQDANDVSIYALPEAWEGDATVGLEGVAGAAPPFQVVEAGGNFRFSYLPVDGNDVIRILPDKKTPGTSLTLAWPIGGESDEPRLTPGTVLVLGASARAYSRPDGVLLTIREFDGEHWSSSSVPMGDVDWTDYSVVRQLGENAIEVQVGLDWTLPDENAWLEFRNMELAILPAQHAARMDLSPTDTPVEPAPRRMTTRPALRLPAR